MAGFVRGSESHLRSLLHRIAESCMELDAISDKNLEHTENILECVEMLCDNFIKDSTDAKTMFMKAFLNGEE